MELYFSIFEVESMKILLHFDFCVLYRTISSAVKSSRHPKSQNTLPDEPPTAECPFCHTDSVIGDASGFPITKDFLKKMKKRWF